MKRLFTLIVLMLTLTTVFAQESETVEMADTMRANGGIYVVVATLTIIFLGLAVYLFALDKRLKKIENEK
ncbi:CcmD family protein [Mucilaginibacter hurinus]|uniref:CcmD family protein n=1 Tax=Mucilaginibacter hurinus TaxID=2201324 RepID=A0A367GTZ5_9SPHI|nr:CcmD family protein [Mucilaginibacter hurinus]RCH56173.1 CcmD family protein [Mucilaginibacter hurinus]